MLEPVHCGPLSRAPLLPKLRGCFAEFLNNASSVGLRILSSPTCVGLRYGYHMNNSGFSRYMAHRLPYSVSVRITVLAYVTDLPFTHLAACTRLSIPRPGSPHTSPQFCHIIVQESQPAVHRLTYPGKISFTLETLDIRPRGFPPLSRYSFRHSLFHTLHSSFRYCFARYAMLLYQCISTFPGFGVVFQPRTFSAQDLSTSELLRTL